MKSYTSHDAVDDDGIVCGAKMNKTSWTIITVSPMLVFAVG